MNLGNAKLTNFKNKSGLLMHLVSFYGQYGWVLCILALLTVAGIVALPLMIPAWIAARWYRNKKISESESQARNAFKDAGFDVSRELKAENARFLIDEKQGGFAYWMHGSFEYTPGIAMFSEVTEAGWKKEGDSYTNVAIGMDMKSTGATEFAVKFARLDQPVFSFNIRSPRAAEVLMQQFTILADLT